MIPSGFRFAEPWWLLLGGLVILPWIEIWKQPRLTWPVSSSLAASGFQVGRILPWCPALVRSLTILLLTIALARPQTSNGLEPVRASGITVVVALDVSASMAKQRGTTSWLEQAKQSVIEFVRNRPADQVGLVAFARSPDTTCPPTLDHDFLIEAARAVVVAPPQDAGPSLGDALIWAGQEALSVEARRRVVVLISDGREEPGSSGDIPPAEAALLAHEQGIVVHIFALGEGSAEDAAGDEPALLLAEIARQGGGQVFNAMEGGQLDLAFGQLDRLERTLQSEVIPVRYKDWFRFLIGLAMVCLLAEAVLLWTRCRTLP